MARIRPGEKQRETLLASEHGALYKTGDCPLEVGLAGLSPYEVITGSLGFQQAYRLFNLAPGARCERLFELGGDWISLESGRPAADFGVLAVSISYEQEIVWLVEMLHSLGVPLRAGERGDGDPVILCGGPVVTSNPEPLAPFVDVCGIGDAELLIPRFCESWHATLGAGSTRDEFLGALLARPGFYVPRYYNIVRGASPEPADSAAPATVSRQVAALGDTPVHSVVVSNRSHFRSMFLVEVARGCRWRCKFCMVCRINDPYRCVNVLPVVELLESLPPGTRSVGLVGANLCDHPQLGELLEHIASRGLRAGVSSLRIGSLDAELLGLLRRCGVNSLTVAPESASPSLLKAIGKGYDPSQLLELAALAGREGFSSLKLYYIAGLPDETDADRELLAAQLAELDAVAGRALKLKASINPFIPKPHTAWQDRSMMPQGEIKKLFKALKQQVNRAAPGVELSWQPPAEASSQAVLSLGGRELAQALERSAVERVRLLDCLADIGVEVEKLLHQREKPAAGHPWKVLECEPSIQT